MPSPFPGMDPYLEGEEWVSFHAQFAVEIARQLAPLLRPRYIARAERQYVFDAPDPLPELAVRRSKREKPSRPDVSVVELRETGGGGSVAVAAAAAAAERQRQQSGAGGAVAAAPLQLATPILEPFPTYRVKVEDVVERDLVTAIELLSPANKRGGRTDYRRTRRRILAGPTHLIEIDLTRRGRRVPMTDPLPPAPYFVLLSRVQRRPVMDVWPIGLRDPLPTVPVPLLPGDADVVLDLRQAFTTVYDVFGYDLVFDYKIPPQVRLPPDEEAWADARLRAAGLRP